MYIYIYIPSYNLLCPETYKPYHGKKHICVPQPLQGSKMVESCKKRSLSVREQENLQKCLKVPGVSEENARQLWNIANELREDAKEASKRQLYNVVRQRFAASAPCFREEKIKRIDGNICSS